MRLLLLLCLGALLVLAGCTAVPFGGPAEQERPVTLVINNSANATHTFEVSVVKGVMKNNEIKIQKKSGEVDSASPGPGLSGYKLDGDYGYVTSVKLPPNRSQLYGRYTLNPGENNRSSIENFEIGSTVVVVIYDGSRVVSLVAAHCDGELIFLNVTMRYYGSDSAYNCQGGFF